MDQLAALSNPNAFTANLQSYALPGWSPDPVAANRLLGTVDPSSLISNPGLGVPLQSLALMNQTLMLLAGTLLTLMRNGQAPNQGPSPNASGSAAGSNPNTTTNASGSADLGQSGSMPANVNLDRLVQALPASRQRPAREHFPIILKECQKQGVTDKAQMAYILATTVHESGAGQHMEEFASGAAYEGRASLGNTQAGDGTKFKGRGYVQLTGRRNYSDWSRRLGIDLVNNPNQAKDPAIAARILVQGMKEGTFTGKRLDQYLGNGKSDFTNARRIINGTDKAAEIGETARKLMAAM